MSASSSTADDDSDQVLASALQSLFSAFETVEEIITSSSRNSNKVRERSIVDLTHSTSQSYI